VVDNTALAPVWRDPMYKDRVVDITALAPVKTTTITAKNAGQYFKGKT